VPLPLTAEQVKKREFRKLWIQRIGAAVQQYNINYSRCASMLLLDRDTR
jgi:ribosomal protein L20